MSSTNMFFISIFNIFKVCGEKKAFLNRGSRNVQICIIILFSIFSNRFNISSSILYIICLAFTENSFCFSLSHMLFKPEIRGIMIDAVGYCSPLMIFVADSIGFNMTTNSCNISHSSSKIFGRVPSGWHIEDYFLGIIA